MESITDFTKKVPSLMSLMAFIVFNASFRTKTALIRPVNETWEVRRVWSWKQWEMGHACASYDFANQHVSLLASHLYYLFFKYAICIINQFSVLSVILSQAASQWLWNCIVSPSQKDQTPIFHMWTLRPFLL